LGSELFYFFKKKNLIVNGSYFKSRKRNLIRLNLFDVKDINFKLKKYNPNVVINCVALTDVNMCEKNFQKSLISNKHSAENLVKSLKKINKKIHLIYISTDQVYNNKRKDKSNKEQEVNLTNNYSKTKYMAERVTKNYKYHTIIRTNFFGKGKYSKKKSYSDYILKLLKKDKKVLVPNNIIFSPISINILVNIIKKIISKKILGTFNVGSNEKITKHQFVLKLVKSKKLKLKNIIDFKSIYKKNKRPLNTSMDISKLKNKLKINIPNIDKQLKTKLFT
jgi:dTDP-4-dehydrorhamnose reductase